MMNYANVDTIEELFKIGMKRDIGLVPVTSKCGLTLNLGAGENPIQGAINMDLPDWDAEVPSCLGSVKSESVAIIHAHHFLEHITNVVELLWECQRVLVKFGSMFITVPYWNCQMAHQDLNHVHNFSLDTWKELFRNPFYDTRQHQQCVNVGNWSFDVKFNAIIGIKESNLAICTQLIKI